MKELHPVVQAVQTRNRDRCGVVELTSKERVHSQQVLDSNSCGSVSDVCCATVRPYGVVIVLAKLGVVVGSRPGSSREPTPFKARGAGEEDDSAADDDDDEDYGAADQRQPAPAARAGKLELVLQTSVKGRTRELKFTVRKLLEPCTHRQSGFLQEAGAEVIVGICPTRALSYKAPRVPLHK